ncbi:response regulator [Methylobacterium sp. NMS14P]|uniref:response regulator n=1 Tax=Methylobacterium TaxID=407 RepID=UPI001F28D063|nr:MULTISPECIES: response regulator [Methylobacterium]UIY43540.1 response regulator [Methylobacterium radiotolerans]WCS24206.1 response regulator [Methylobacterium sp. NMS14P]
MTTETRSPRPLAVVADDNAMIRLNAADILEDAGYTPIEAYHGDHALSMLKQHHPNVQVLFTDVQMPGGRRDGFALAREVAVCWPHIAIVVASGEMHPQPGDLPEGATFIPKPFSAEVVREHLLKVVPEEDCPAPLKTSL